jgi:large subunit ribosomal protein L13e
MEILLLIKCFCCRLFKTVIPGEHFHKKWARRVKTWLHQPIQKKIRRDKRKERAAKLAPRPASGVLRPLVHAPTQKYNSKIRLGRGFTLEELKVLKSCYLLLLSINILFICVINSFAGGRYS